VDEKAEKIQKSEGSKLLVSFRVNDQYPGGNPCKGGKGKKEFIHYCGKKKKAREEKNIPGIAKKVNQDSTTAPA